MKAKKWTIIITFLMNKKGKLCEFQEIKLKTKLMTEDQANALAQKEARKVWSDFRWTCL